MEYQFSHLKKVLVANRGEIAVRLITACRKVGLKSVSIYTNSDATSLHASLADENILLPGENANGYLDIEEILKICQRLCVDAIIPGYGFLSEDANFAQKVADAGMVFVGPSPKSMTEMGQKHRARDLAVSSDVPIVPGTPLLDSEKAAVDAAKTIGFPIMLKATGGGGGMGLQVCETAEEISEAFKKVKSRGETLFYNAGVFLEKYYPQSRHIEVQIFGNGSDVVHFGERECSIQRRHQKVIEECPSSFVAKRPGMRERLTKCAIAYALQLKYKSAGTIEFLVDDNTGDFFFLEMNTRLQVEHGITELCYGVDLVALMLQQADCEKGGETGLSSEFLHSLQKDGPNGAAIEARVYAEVPFRNYAPSPGLLQAVKWPKEEGFRVDTWVKSGQRIASFYDPLIAKVMVHAKDRHSACEKMTKVLSESVLQGPPTNIHFLTDVVASKSFLEGDTLTNFLETKFKYEPCAIDVLSPGSFTTVQDFPARSTSGHGIPKGGPMDSLSSRIANVLVGNEPGMEVLEMTLTGPELLFTAPAVFSVCGAPVSVTIDGEEKPMWSRLTVRAGQKLKIGKVENGGLRFYLAVKGGFPEIPLYLGSKAGTPSLGFGGTQGRQLQMGDWLELNRETAKWAENSTSLELPRSCVPGFNISEVYCMHGPHDSDDFMTEKDKRMLYSTAWKIGHNSNRTGVRLVGPVPEWSRKDGGEGGSHPSNIFDYGYPSPGGINWGGDSAVIFSIDSPDLGGLLCSSTVISADLWRLGQVKPGGYLKLKPTTFEMAIELTDRIEKIIKDVQALVDGTLEYHPKLDLTLPDSGLEEGKSNAILKTIPADGERQRVVYRQGGDCFLLVEIGIQTVDVRVTTRIRLLVEKLQNLETPKLVMNPNVGSVMIQFDPKAISQHELLQIVHQAESSIQATTDIKIPCREVHLPVVFDHPDIAASEQRYIETNRPTAVYLPDNVEYLRTNNGLATRRETFETLLKSPYLIVAVGFLVGTPILSPLEPMSGIVGQKYNPTRVSTPGGTIGMGGSLFAIYPVEAPGGYMMFARTMECWDSFGHGPSFTPTRPWLYEPFDIVKYHEVSVDEYDNLMLDYKRGNYKFDIRDGVFNLAEVHAVFEKARGDSKVKAFRDLQRKSVANNLAIEKKLYGDWVAEQEAEKEREANRVKEMMDAEPAITIDSPIDANVWKVLVEPGDTLKEGQVVAILEAMKMEINVVCDGEAVGKRVEAIASKPGSVVSPGAWIVVVKGDEY
ncbi:putative urea carboxylase [Lachnellula suecica]|uniref:Putative urea carboxylase n=1 Tax=Lachnellula suecica TaxID=602035 RepID=A0A8T9C982_9HELO|nr:putative urea carboxylase [Lachnellula suecica]